MWPFWGEQIDPGKLTKALSDGQVYKDKKTDCQTDIKGKDDGNGKKEKKKKKDRKREVMERLQWAGYHLALTPTLFLLLENWSVNRLKSSKKIQLAQ